jgi:hypothetical protein
MRMIPIAPFVVSLSKLASRFGLSDDFAIAEASRPRSPPFLLISQLPRSGGNLFSQLCDHHPQLLTHPFELRISAQKTVWPEHDPTENPARLFARLFQGASATPWLIATARQVNGQLGREILIRLDQHGAEVVDIGKRRPGHEQIADRVEEGPGIVVGEHRLGIDPGLRRAGERVGIDQGAGIIL